MTSEELGLEVYARTLAAAEAAEDRILGVGRKQYERNGEQSFEKHSVAWLLNEFREEAQDIIAYGVMLDMKLQYLEEMLDGINDDAPEDHDYEETV